MNYILEKVSVNANADRFGGRDSVNELAISSDKDALEAYCLETYNESAADSTKFRWTYYRIVESEILIK